MNENEQYSVVYSSTQVDNDSISLLCVYIYIILYMLQECSQDCCHPSSAYPHQPTLPYSTLLEQSGGLTQYVLHDAEGVGSTEPHVHVRAVLEMCHDLVVVIDLQLIFR